MSPMTRFIIRALPTLVGFIVGGFVGLVIVSLLGVYGLLATVVSVAAGLGLAYAGFRVGGWIAERRDEEAYAEAGYPQEYDQRGYGPQGYEQGYGQYPPYQG